jgi:hypothetical protein
VKPLRQSSIDDLASLQMENELLMHEIRYLRARVTSAERQASHVSRAQRAAPKPEKPAKSAKSERIAEEDRPMPGTAASDPEGGAGHAVEMTHRQAEEDLRWLLRRLDESPLGLLLRRKQGFRTLLSRYPHQP